MRGSVIVVYGPPGSGKSTLALALARTLDLPCIDRDEFKDTLFDVLGYSDRSWSIRVGAASWALLRLVVNKLGATGRPFIVETNFRPDDHLVEELRDLSRTAASVVSIRVTARSEVLWRRFQERRRTGGRHPGHAGFETAEEFASALAEHPHRSIDLGGATLDIDTSDSWPDPVEVADWVRTKLPALGE